MKTPIVIGVIILHLLVLALLLGPSPARTPNDSRDREPAASSDASDDEPGPAGRQFDMARFAVLDAPLPAELESKTKDCKTGVLLDWTQERVLWAKQPETVVPIASLTKMMTVLLLVEAVRDEPGITLESPVKVTSDAWRVGGSEVYLDPRETFSLDELLKCILIHSANDAAYLVAQFLGKGDVSSFVERMNRKAAAMGLRNTRFHNPHGLPLADRTAENQGTAGEMAFLAGNLLDYPEVVRWSGKWRSQIRQDTDKPFDLVSRNRLVKDCPGVNGMKTGYTRKARYCVAATCERQDRVLIAVLTGCGSEARRNDLATNLFDWGYTQTQIRGD